LANYGSRFRWIANTTTPSAIRQMPVRRLGHGLTVGALAVMKKEATASRMPTATHSQARTRITYVLDVAPWDNPHWIGHAAMYAGPGQMETDLLRPLIRHRARVRRMRSHHRGISAPPTLPAASRATACVPVALFGVLESREL